MKKLMMLSAVAALMLGGSAYAAGVDDSTVKIPAPQASFKLYKGTFDNYANRYALSNDKTIKFTQSGGHYWARLKLEDRVELFPVAANTFVTAAGTRIEFLDRGVGRDQGTGVCRTARGGEGEPSVVDLAVPVARTPDEPPFPEHRLGPQ